MSEHRLLASAAVVMLVVMAACNASSTEPQPKFGEAVDVRIGTSVRIPNDTTSVQFSDVTADSRCAQGVLCVWEGDAAVVFTVGGATASALHTAAVSGPTTMIVNGKRLTLVSLAPFQKVGQTIAKGDYVATIRFDEAKD